MLSQPMNAMISAARLLFKRRTSLALIVGAYAGLIGAAYLFVTTREATIFQLVLTAALVLIVPALFFVLQAASVSYTGESAFGDVIKNCLRLAVVSLPVIGLTLLGLYGLKKLDSHQTVATTLRYLLIGVVIPLLAIQLWIATSSDGLRALLRSLPAIVLRTLAPQSLFVYACGFLIFAVGPYFLIVKAIPVQRAWLELLLLLLRLSTAAVLILLGWVTTVGAISILNRRSYSRVTEE